MLHYLRIAVTALSLTACVLFLALWIRSFTRYDSIEMLIYGEGVYVRSWGAIVTFSSYGNDNKSVAETFFTFGSHSYYRPGSPGMKPGNSIQTMPRYPTGSLSLYSAYLLLCLGAGALAFARF